MFQQKTFSTLYRAFDSANCSFLSRSFLGASRSYFFPSPFSFLTLHEISLYFTLITQNTLNFYDLPEYILFSGRNDDGIQHKNIVKYLTSFSDDSTNTVCIIMEYCGNFNLKDIFQRKMFLKSLTNEKNVCLMIRILASALHYIHQQ